MNRRNLVKLSIGSVAALFGTQAIAGAAEVCVRAMTPRQPEGPFYPVKDQQDTDWDLTSVNGSNLQAAGRKIMVTGKLTDQNCRPVSGALVEIWQACETGKYNHASDPNPAALDPNFQYWGKSVTDEEGNYKFLTIVPGAYPAGDGWVRPPHIHFKVSKLGYLELITQMYFAGDSLNEHDLILKRLSPQQQSRVVIELENRTGLSHPVAEFHIQMEKVGSN